MNIEQFVEILTSGLNIETDNVIEDWDWQQMEMEEIFIGDVFSGFWEGMVSQRLGLNVNQSWLSKNRT